MGDKANNIVNKDQIKTRIIERIPFMSNIKFDIVELRSGYIKIKVYHSKNIERYDGILFGGFIALIFDALLGIAVYTVNDKKNQVTLSLNVRFLRKAKSDYYIFEGYVVKKGKYIVFTEGIMYSSNKISAKAEGVWYIFDE